MLGLFVTPFPFNLFGTGRHPRHPVRMLPQAWLRWAETPWRCQNWGPGVQTIGQYLWGGSCSTSSTGLSGGPWVPRGAGHLKRTERAQLRLSLHACWVSYKSRKGQALKILTSKWVSTWAQRKAKGGGRVMRELHCLGAEPDSRKPPFPEEM